MMQLIEKRHLPSKLFGTIEISFLLTLAGCASLQDRESTVALDNGTMRMTINVYGGAISSCVLNEQGLNPFGGTTPEDPEDSHREGMFICFDRLGPASAAAKKQGIPGHGEAHSVLWEVLEESVAENGNHILRMRCYLPIARMTLNREYCLFPDSSVCRITDRVRNENPFNKSYNIVQHPKHGAPFLDDSILVDCNASHGFVNTRNINEIPGPTIQWPDFEYNSHPINLRHMKDGQSMVANFVMSEADEYAWGCVSNPSQELMVGCFWETADYPWLRVWRDWEEETPIALGIEFGTTPLAIPLEDIHKVKELFSRATIESLEPNAEATRSFYLFLSKIPSNFSGVEALSLHDGKINVEERASENKRQWTLPGGPIYPKDSRN